MKDNRKIFNWFANAGEKILNSTSWQSKLVFLFLMVGSVVLFTRLIDQSKELTLITLALLLLGWVIYAGLMLTRFIKDLRKK